MHTDGAIIHKQNSHRNLTSLKSWNFQNKNKMNVLIDASQIADFVQIHWNPFGGSRRRGTNSM
jgi:hypothetical protein